MAGEKATTTRADVGDPTAVAHMFDSAEAVYGGVDVTGEQCWYHAAFAHS
jgi:NAD(P)-dependent dehydrogenase (short-subunit alcohol dehydrogenase family)